MTVATMTTDQIAAELEQRVKALYRLNAELAAQVDRQGKVVDTAIALVKVLRRTPAWSNEEAALEYAVREYQREMAELVEQNSDGLSTR